jgi:chromosome segregation ATPase
MANPLDLLKDLAAKFAGIEAALAKVTTAEERVKALEQSASATKSELEAEQKAHAETKAALQKAQDEVNARDTKIKTLEAAVTTEQQRANETIASQGLSLDQVPAGSAGSSEPKANAWATYQKLLASDAQAAGAFYAANADAILSSRK